MTVGVAGSMFQGTFTGTRTNTSWSVRVAIDQPSGVAGSFAFDEASITGSRITGTFAIDVSYIGLPIGGTGGYTIERAP